MAKDGPTKRAEGRPRTSEEVSVETLFRRALTLSHHGQLQLYALLGERLADAGRPPTQQEQLIERQLAALDAMREVAAALDLPEQQSPTTTQFTAESKRLGLAWTVSSVGRAFNGWRNAQEAFEGGSLPEASRHIRLRRNFVGVRGRSRADHLAVVREWLEDEPAAELPEDYNDWRVRFNERLADTEEALAVRWEYLRQVFPGCGTEDIIAAARGQIQDVEEYCRNLAEQRLAAARNPLRLVNVRDSAALLGLTENVTRTRMRNDPAFPKAVVTIAAEDFLHLPDVRAYREGRAKPRAPEGKFADRALGSRQVADRLGIGLVLLRHRVVNEEWDRVPPPAGRASSRHYWLSEQLARWETEHPPETRKGHRRAPPVKRRSR